MFSITEGEHLDFEFIIVIAFRSLMDDLFFISKTQTVKDEFNLSTNLLTV